MMTMGEDGKMRTNKKFDIDIYPHAWVLFVIAMDTYVHVVRSWRSAKQLFYHFI
jgi:hypothetical protein